MGSEPPVVEGPSGVSPPGGTVDSRNGPQTSTGRDVGVSTHLDGAVNGGTGLYQMIYCAPPEHGCTIHFDQSYHGLVSSGGVESRNAPI